MSIERDIGPVADQRQSLSNVVCRPVAEDAARTAVVMGLLAMEPLFDVPGAWDAKEQAIRNLASKARDALRAMEKPS